MGPKVSVSLAPADLYKRELSRRGFRMVAGKEVAIVLIDMLQFAYCAIVTNDE